MNNTLSTFSDFNKYKTIQIFNREHNHQLTNNENKYNLSYLFNKIESVRGNHRSNLNFHSEKNTYINNKKHINKEQSVISNLKHLSIKKKKIFNNNINILKFNNDVCSKTINTNFTGKKILFSKYNLMNKSKLSENEKNKNKNNIKYLLTKDGKGNKTLEINSTVFEKYNNIHGLNNGKFFSTKIEKELNDILNKNKNIKSENNSDNYKTQFNDKTYNSLVNNNNESKLKNNNENLFLFENKLIKEQKGNYLNKENFKNDLFNHYLNSNIIKRKVLFIDKYNNTLLNDNTITLLSEEKDLLLEKYFMHKDDKGNEINLPLLQRYNEAANQNSKFVTEFNDNLGKRNNTTNDHTQSSSLSQLIKNRFTKHYYKNIKIGGFPLDYEYYSRNLMNVDDIKKEESFNNITSNINRNRSPFDRRNRKNDFNMDGLNDILGVIKAKTIGPTIQKQKNKPKKSPNRKIEVKENIKKETSEKKLKRLLSEPNIISNVYQISNKIFFNKEKEINSLINIPISVKDIRGKKMNVKLIKKKNDIIPINEEGIEVKNAKIINDLYEKVKELLKSRNEKNLLPKKRLTFTHGKDYVASLLDNPKENKDVLKSNIEDEKKQENIKKDKSGEKKDKKENISPKKEKVQLKKGRVYLII